VLFLTPHRLSPDDHEIILDILTGGSCVGLAREVMEDRLRGREFSAVGKVTNREVADSAAGCLQYLDLCEEGSPQLWMNDLCRYRDSTKPKPAKSPAAVLIDLFEGLGHEYKIPAIHTAVAGADATERPDLYVGYGFASSFCDLPEEEGSDLVPEKAVDAKSETHRQRRITRKRATRHK
jgi:hypothetical protein